mmetsp:Transcript_17208/g.25602  ORF Transcript_17208/g.25602 Transcript_17208/m.25602 type:complete len:324 (-) Transcript_17208:190-1161(-)
MSFTTPTNIDPEQHCTVLAEHLDPGAIAFLNTQGISSAHQLLSLKTQGLLFSSSEKSRLTSPFGAESMLAKALHKWRFVLKNDKKPTATKLVDYSTQIKSCVQMLHRWVRKVKIVEGVPCSKGTKQMASHQELGLVYTGGELYLLGDKPREFLATQGIYDGDALLKTKTGELGCHYAAWRAGKGLKPLKSPGGASSISGWKNVVKTSRKTARGVKAGDKKRASKKKANPQDPPSSVPSLVPSSTSTTRSVESELEEIILNSGAMPEDFLKGNSPVKAEATKQSQSPSFLNSTDEVYVHALPDSVPSSELLCLENIELMDVQMV